MSRLTRSVSATSVVIGRAATTENAPSDTSTNTNMALSLSECPAVRALVLGHPQHPLGVRGGDDVLIGATGSAPQHDEHRDHRGDDAAEHQRHPDED